MFDQFSILCLWLALAAGLLTAGAFLVFFGPVSRRIRDVSAAMDRISEGDLSPWLPPPSDGEVGELSMATQSMATHIDRTISRLEQQRRSTFISDLTTHVARKVRNPLSSIQLNLQILDREISRGEIPSDYNALMDICIEEIRRLDNLMAEIQSIGALPSRPYRPCSLRTIVDQAIEIVGPDLRDRDIAVQIPRWAERDEIIGNEEGVRALLVNLLLNARDAMEAREESARIWITSENRPGPNADGRRWIVVRVGDEGEGVDPEIRDEIFRPFFTTKPDASGIGLTLARATAEAHGGELHFEAVSELEPGAVFALFLPLYRVGDERNQVAGGEPVCAGREEDPR